MDKIINYIKRGSGFGFIFILAVAVLKTIPFMVEMKRAYTDLQPKIMLIAEDFLPIRVENEKIIEPFNTYKRVDLQFGDNVKDALPVVLDTREETSVVPNEKDGLFIMSDMIYFIAGDRIQKYKLRNGVIDKVKFEKTLETTSGFVSLLSVVFFVVLFSVSGIIKACSAALICFFALRLMKKENVFGFRALTRLGSVLVALSMLVFEHYVIGFVLIPVVMLWFLHKENMSE